MRTFLKLSYQEFPYEEGVGVCVGRDADAPLHWDYFCAGMKSLANVLLKLSLSSEDDRIVLRI
jgi:hypothetical protein